MEFVNPKKPRNRPTSPHNTVPVQHPAHTPHATPKPVAKPTIIELKDVNQSFAVGDEVVDILHDINFKIQQQSFNIIYGPSGSGKSTVLNILTGLQKPSRGDISFNGLKLYDLKPDQLAHFRANEIGIVYQQNYWVKSLTVIENVALPLFFVGYSRKEAHKRALEALGMVNMQSYAQKHPTLLSGGEQQRVAMARALVNNPLFVIADEPTGSLDSKNGDMIMELLQQCQSEFGRTIILVSHNMEYIPLADHLLRIEDGRMVETQDDADITATATTLLDAMKARITKLKGARRG
jgi:ABC-type lipoprotein export system ATPase subunit